MASRFESDFPWDAWASVHGESCTITPSGGSPTTVTAVFERGAVLEGQSEPRGNRAFGVLIVPPGSVSGWTPSVNDTVTIGSVDYEVDQIGELEPAVELQLVAVDA